MKTARALVTVLLLLISAGAAAQSSQLSKKEKLEKEIELLDKQLKENAKKSSSALTNLKASQKKVSVRKQLVSESDKEIKVLNNKIYNKQREINRIQQRLDTLSTYYSKLVKNAYKNRDSRIWYMYILSSRNLGQGFKRYAYLKNLSGQMNAQAEKLQAAKDELNVQKKQMEGLRAEAKILRDQRQNELDQLKKEEAENQKIVKLLNKDKKKYQKQLADKKKQVEALNREVGKLIASSGGRKSKPVDVQLSAEFAANKGKLPWPVEGSVVDTFGEHYHPVYTKIKLPFNNGVGIVTKKGAPVKAVFNGVVKQIIVMPGYNQCILIQHGEYFTFYCKLGSVSVKAGEKVKTGQTIGKVDTIGGETQLHFELWEGKKPRNPEFWLY